MGSEMCIRDSRAPATRSRSAFLSTSGERESSNYSYSQRRDLRRFPFPAFPTLRLARPPRLLPLLARLRAELLELLLMLRGLVRQAREERFRRARGRSPARRRRRRRARGRTSRRRAPDKLRFLRRGGRLRRTLLRRRGRASPRGDGRGAPAPHDAVLARHRAPRRLRGAPPRLCGPPPPRRLIGVERRLREPAGRQRRVGVRIEGPGVCRIGHGLERAVARHGVRRSKQHDAARREACLLYTSPSPRDGLLSRMPSSA